mgnify:CR=1 FL=1
MNTKLILSTNIQNIDTALGLHRTDMALSTYWMFYGVDNGMKPPILRGHIADGELVLDRLNNKVFRRLNSLYAYLMGNNVVHIPDRETFSQRKRDLIISHSFSRA